MGVACNPSTKEADSRCQGQAGYLELESPSFRERETNRRQHSKSISGLHTYACILALIYTDTLETSIRTLIHWQKKIPRAKSSDRHL